MSEISLLMTGVLTTGQPYVPNLPKQQLLHRENGLQNSIQSQLPPVISNGQITPPEFMETDGTSLNSALSSQSSQENLLKELDKDLSHYSRSLMADSLIVRAKVQKLNSQTLPTIRFGSSGITVRILQRLLIAHGYGMGVDGVFGPLTETAVKAFQNRRNLIVDGIVGQRTWRELTL